MNLKKVFFNSDSISANYLIRKVIYKVVFQNIFLKFSISKLKFFLQTNCLLEKDITKVKVIGISNSITISKDANIYPNVILEITNNSILKIGNNFTISYNSIISCRKQIIIGDNVMIGENTSIRDCTHDHKTISKIPFCKRQDVCECIFIGNNVWIGRGCIILPGTKIGDNVVVGANSVVKGNLASNTLYAGAPVKQIREI